MMHGQTKINYSFYNKKHTNNIWWAAQTTRGTWLEFWAMQVLAALSYLPVNAHMNLYSGHDQFLQLSRSTIHRCVLYMAKVQTEILAVQSVTAGYNSAGFGPWVLGMDCTK